jgi:hypothetical protein
VCMLHHCLGRTLRCRRHRSRRRHRTLPPPLRPVSGVALTL